MEVKVFDKKNNETGSLGLPEAIFNIEWNPDLVHQAFVAHQANRRQKVAHTKDRSEKRGGGRKPWRQKGTGRARHGSIRSPLWAGGGVTFGPRKEKKIKKKINKKMKRKALFAILSKKLEDEEIFIMESFNLPEYTTRNVKEVIDTFLEDKKSDSIMLIPSESNKNIRMGVGNLENVFTMGAKNLNIYDCLATKYIIFEKESVDELTKHFS